MVVIKILDLVNQASTYEDGDILFNKINQSFNDGEAVTVSFSGIHAVPSAFVNSAFVRLLENFDFEFIKRNLKFIETTKFINELIKDRFYFSSKQ